ncbi:MAG TPA: transketolase [Actinomycetota bacterium]|nr:transketolase [Actinomycetota bacterium]
MAMRTETPSKLDLYRDLARQLRADIIRTSTAAGSGHPTSSLSAADLMAVLLAGHLRYSFDEPDNPAGDHLIFSKGHASPLVYAVFRAAGAIDDEELLTNRKFGSRLQGHPTPIIPWVDVATGSLGQGLPIAVGVALAAKRPLGAPYHVWTLVGDSESAEGSIWEGFARGGFEKLDNITAIIDVNRLGQRGPTELEWDTETYARRISAFGWNAIIVDGHDLEEIDNAMTEALNDGQPTAIVAKTLKGAGVSFLADKPGWHGKPLNAEEAEKALAEIGDEPSRTFEVQGPREWTAPQLRKDAVQLKTYTEGVATRKAYGEALVALGDAREDVVVLDAEVSNSTYSEDFKKAHPERFFEMYIAEQQMVAAAVGMQVVGLVPFSSTFAAFLTRAYDFIRMAAISQANIRLSGSHAGVSIGADGPSQMALEDLAMMRAVYGSTVLYPSDANQAAQLVAAMADLDGISYIRTTREKTGLLYEPGDSFPIGGSKVYRSSDNDQVTVVGAGITAHEAVKAADELAGEGINVRLVDAYSVKPFDGRGISEAVKATGGRVVVAEDHWPEGGIADAMLAAFAELGFTDFTLKHLAVREMPGSGDPMELLDAAKISGKHIAQAVRDLLA